MSTYLLVGNYGVGNAGDEALKKYFLERFPEVAWVVVSAHPCSGEVPRLPCGVRSLLTPWWRTLLVYLRCEGVVFGGGSLFTDAESTFAPFLWFLHVAMARLFRKPIFLAFQGIGPFRTRRGAWCARWVVKRAMFCSVRDALSLGRVEHWNLNKKCILSFDPVFSLLLSENSRICSSYSARSSDIDRSKILLIIPRGNSSKEFWDRAKEMRQEGWGGVRVQEPDDLSELCRVVSSASYLLTQRYHAGIVALALGVTFEAVPQVSGDKLDALNHEDRDLVHLWERVKVGEEAFRSALRHPALACAMNSEAASRCA
ncbi:polysaccharide pyruvyl transferase family protein [Candidatus Peregrinibacteria bacterium]|nr:polysaccharide pyruvyl transferase family protein [Candidatus Peregrinibacteria bacterium]